MRLMWRVVCELYQSNGIDPTSSPTFRLACPWWDGVSEPKSYEECQALFTALLAEHRKLATMFPGTCKDLLSSPPTAIDVTSLRRPTHTAVENNSNKLMHLQVKHELMKFAEHAAARDGMVRAATETGEGKYLAVNPPKTLAQYTKLPRMGTLCPIGIDELPRLSRKILAYLKKHKAWGFYGTDIARPGASDRWLTGFIRWLYGFQTDAHTENNVPVLLGIDLSQAESMYTFSAYDVVIPKGKFGVAASNWHNECLRLNSVNVNLISAVAGCTCTDRRGLTRECKSCKTFRETGPVGEDLWMIGVGTDEMLVAWPHLLEWLSPIYATNGGVSFCEGGPIPVVLLLLLGFTVYQIRRGRDCNNHLETKYSMGGSSITSGANNPHQVYTIVRAPEDKHGSFLVPQVGTQQFRTSSTQQRDIRLMQLELTLRELMGEGKLTHAPVIDQAFDVYLGTSPVCKIASQGSTSLQTLVESCINYLRDLQCTPIWMERQLNFEFVYRVHN
jgi:hypothetical protein